MKRDWADARAKVDAEGSCRRCPTAFGVEAAHVIYRAHDVGSWVNPDSIVPLCGPATSSQTCHGLYDAHRLDLLPYLTLAEQVQAVQDAGGIESARRRICGRHQLEHVA
jgi:hypothetical protein